MSTTAEQQRQMSPEVSEFLASGPHQAFVGGQEMASSSGATFTTHDPGSGEQLAEIHDLTAEDVDRAGRSRSQGIQRSPMGAATG